MAEDRAIQGVRKVFCRMTGKICYYANENGYCDSTACHNMNLVGNIIPKERPENISNSSIWAKPQGNWHTGTPTEEGWYILCLYNKGNWYHPHFYVADFYSEVDGKMYWSNDEDWSEYTIVAWQKIEPYTEAST